ncbi:ATP-dependent DNA ligase [Oceanobacillus kimchii]|uniref:SPBc2 prophage-derived DNA ligase-like protein LigB n=1 Tax=Oceanobacillus kimchii TaxID=746691 RepID=A0ABQ5TIF5_9BACI|nr:RNA ligase family protein [Oceanobacillus kimchii]GLO66245.1 SPBc2 prophage-derived DNA ligase-like protein LigB [Oceanobacillus kimchii]
MFVSPMLLQKSDHPFNDDSYITELKLDGIRLIWTKFNDKVRIYTRHNNEVTSLFPELLSINLPDGTVLDGELVSPDDKGKPDFEAIMKRFSSINSNISIQYCVFDILYYNNEKLTSKSLLYRKEILEESHPNDDSILTKVRWIKGHGVDYFNLVEQNQLEGIVLKASESKYDIGKRSHSWLKIISYQYETVLINGFNNKEFKIYLSFLDGSPAGAIEFMTYQNRKAFYSKINVISETKTYIKIDPIMCRVKYRNLTSKGKLRIPLFLEWL